MRDPARVDRIIAKLHEAWSLYPDFRFYQLITSISSNVDGDRYYVEDDVLERDLDQWLARWPKTT